MMNTYIKIVLIVILVVVGAWSLLSSQDEITVHATPIEQVDTWEDEITQIESLVVPTDLIEHDNAHMRYRIEGNGKYLFLEGTINSRFPRNIYKIFEEHPDITWLVLTNVPGSMDDDANLEAAHWLRQQGVNTYIPQGGSVASGGTDLFTAGVKRVLNADSVVGVHSWGAGPGRNGNQVPKDSPEHQIYLDYYAAMGIPAEFYWFTLQSADAHNIYNMTLDEIETYRVATDIIE